MTSSLKSSHKSTTQASFDNANTHKEGKEFLHRSSLAHHLSIQNITFLGFYHYPLQRKSY